MPVAVKQTTVTVNAAFLQEIKEVNQELWQLLEQVYRLCSEKVAAPAQGMKLVAMFSELRDQVALHFALEEAYGYFDDPVFVAPHLGERAELLRSEHRRLYVKIDELAEYVEGLFYNHQLARLMDHVARRFDAFDRRLKEHEQMENELILQAYDEDIGVGD